MSDEIANKTDVFQILRELDFLRGVSDKNVRELAKLGTMIEFPSDVVIFRSGEPALYCYMIIDGTVSLEICGPGVGCTRVMLIGNGELLSCSPLIGETTLMATARTLAPTRAIQLQASEVMNWCEQNHRFGYEVMRCAALAMAKRLTATRLLLLDTYRADTSTTRPD